MARVITCDRCGKITAEDFSTKEAQIPAGFDPDVKPISVSLSVTAADGVGLPDLCQECAAHAADVLASTLRTMA